MRYIAKRCWQLPQVEFNCNDGFAPEYCSELPCKLEYGGINHTLRRGYERLLRKLLMLPHRPAVIMLQTFDFSERWDKQSRCQLPRLICCHDMRLLLLRTCMDAHSSCGGAESLSSDCRCTVEGARTSVCFPPRGAGCT